MVPCETSIIAEQDAVIFVTYQVTKNTLYFGSYLKNELGDRNFLSHKSDRQAKIKLSAKFQKKSVERIQSYLKFSIS